jgi:sporulation protein YlmC with PRC-barrel domain
MEMDTKALLKVIAAAPLLVLAGLVGCDSADDQDAYSQDTYAQQQPEAAQDRDDPAMATTESRSMDRSAATDPSYTQPQSAEDRTWETEDSVAGAQTDALSEEELVDQPVYSRDGEEIGTVANVVADENGESKFAVVDVGDFLGIGGKQVAIDVQNLEMTADGRIQSDVTADLLQSMPEYETSEYEEDAE